MCVCIRIEIRIAFIGQVCAHTHREFDLMESYFGFCDLWDLERKPILRSTSLLKPIHLTLFLNQVADSVISLSLSTPSQVDDFVFEDFARLRLKSTKDDKDGDPFC